MTSPLRPASQVQDLVSRCLQERRPHSRRPALSGKRTTFTAPAATIRELRSLALQHDCLMNDLVPPSNPAPPRRRAPTPSYRDGDAVEIFRWIEW
jgi:hypothetical protein